MSYESRLFMDNNFALEIMDYSDETYGPARSNYVELLINIPSSGANQQISWTVDVDGSQVDSGSLNLTFSFGPVDYDIRRVYVYPSGKVLTWHFNGGSQIGSADFEIDLLVAKIPIAYIRKMTGFAWRPAIPYVKDGGVWKQAKPMIHTANGWADTTS